MPRKNAFLQHTVARSRLLSRQSVPLARCRRTASRPRFRGFAICRRAAIGDDSAPLRMHGAAGKNQRGGSSLNSSFGKPSFGEPPPSCTPSHISLNPDTRLPATGWRAARRDPMIRVPPQRTGLPIDICVLRPAGRPHCDNAVHGSGQRLGVLRVQPGFARGYIARWTPRAGGAHAAEARRGEGSRKRGRRALRI